MAGVYLDTSALGRVLLGEPDAPTIVRELVAFERRMASRLLAVELRRVALRDGALTHEADQLLGGLSLVPLDDALLTAAESVTPATVGTLDAIHLVTALRLAGLGFVDAIMTFDRRLAEGARAHGLRVLAPR